MTISDTVRHRPGAGIYLSRSGPSWGLTVLNAAIVNTKVPGPQAAGDVATGLNLIRRWRCRQRVSRGLSRIHRPIGLSVIDQCHRAGTLISRTGMSLETSHNGGCADEIPIKTVVQTGLFANIRG